MYVFCAEGFRVDLKGLKNKKICQKKETRAVARPNPRVKSKGPYAKEGCRRLMVGSLDLGCKDTSVTGFLLDSTK